MILTELTITGKTTELINNATPIPGGIYTPNEISQIRAFKFLSNPKTWNVKVMSNTNSDNIQVCYASKKKAVYILYDKGTVVYVGKTHRDNPYQRPLEHKQEKEGAKEYDRAEIILVPEDVCLSTLEALLIYKYKEQMRLAKYNKVVPKSKEYLKSVLSKYNKLK